MEKLMEMIKDVEFKSTSEILKEIEEDMNSRTDEQKHKGQMVLEEMKHQELIDNEQFKKEYGYSKYDI